MADRIAALEAEKSSLEIQVSTSSPAAKGASSSAAPSATDDMATAQTRLDLAEALRSKGVSESRLRTAEEELTKFRAKSKEDARSIRDLSLDRTTLTTRLKDREHELREKRKLLEVCTTGTEYLYTIGWLTMTSKYKTR